MDSIKYLFIAALLLASSSFQAQNSVASPRMNKAKEYLTVKESSETTQKGMHTEVVFDAETQSFSGTVQNVSRKPLNAVRVEIDVLTASGIVHLGPSRSLHLDPGETCSVALGTDGMSFEKWRVVVVNGER